jgi:hypothetical protein
VIGTGAKGCAAYVEADVVRKVLDNARRPIDRVVEIAVADRRPSSSQSYPPKDRFPVMSSRAGAQSRRRWPGAPPAELGAMTSLADDSDKAARTVSGALGEVIAAAAEQRPT